MRWNTDYCHKIRDEWDGNEDKTYLTNNHTVSMSDYQMLVQCQAWQLSLIATMMFSCWKPIGSSYADGMRTIYMTGSI